jgi:hypothetical protein
MNTRYVIYHPINGIYLGSIVGLEFWSKLNPSGQNGAITFASVQEAMNTVLTFTESPKTPYKYKYIPLNVKDMLFASIEECHAVNLPIWDPLM